MEEAPPREPFAQIPHALLLDHSVPAEAVRAYGVICACSPAPDGWRYLHAKKLAAQLGINERNAKRYTAQLCKAGWLHKEGDGGCNRPARYRPLTVKTMSSGDTVSDQNHVTRRHGQEVDTADSSTMAVVSGNSPRARENASATAGTAPGKKEFLKLHVGFVPPGGWKPILGKARKARLDAGKGSLPISEEFLIEKFLQRKAGKELTIDVIESDLMEWYCLEKPPRKQRPATPARTAEPPTNPTVTAAPLDASPRPSELREMLAALTKKTSAPLATLPSPRIAAPSQERFESNPARRARLAEQARMAGTPLPANCQAV